MTEGEANRIDEQGWKAHLLNESQRRSLSTVLRRVELAAWRLEERLSRETPPQLALTRFTHPPDAAQRTALVHLVQYVRQQVADLATDYHLPVVEENVIRSILGEFTLLWCDLEDSRPQKLRRYGAIHPQADDVLGPRITRLIELVLAIDGVASGKHETIDLWKEARKYSPEG